jgi:hypothetical protein
MERGIVDEIEKKSKCILINSLFTFIVSISAIMFGSKSNFWAFFMGGWAGEPDKNFESLLVTVAFLVAWLLYGILMGYTKKKSFMKFISLYWGIGGLIGLTGVLLSPIGKWAIIVIPVDILILVPTYGLTYYFPSSYSLHLIICITSSWSAGAIGYLLGYLLKKLRVSTLSDK